MDHSSVLIDASADFPRLDQVVHIAYFVPVNWGGQDKVSRSVVDFQHHREPQTEQWIRLAETLLHKVPCDVIVRVLSSRESTADGKAPLDLLCTRLARRLGVPYAPERLWKTRRTLAVKNAGSLSARRKAILGAYEFSGHGLPPNARVLVVDDIITTGATALTVSSAIRKEIPGAAVRLFTLVRTNPHLVRLHLEEVTLEQAEEPVPMLEMNPHIDERYFSRSVAPEIVLPRERKFTPAAPPTLPHPPARPVPAEPPKAEPEVAEPVASETEHDLEIPPEFGLDGPMPVATDGATAPHVPAGILTEASVPARAAVPGERKPPSARRLISTLANPLAIGMGVALVVFVGVFLANQFLATDVQVARIPPPEQYTPVQPQEEPAKPPPAPKKRPQLPRGTVNVPSVRLRSEPSLEALVLPTEIRMSDRVTILRRNAAAAGPDWIEVRTSAGISGWVFSGVVTPDSTARPSP
jgi:hypothetical protein